MLVKQKRLIPEPLNDDSPWRMTRYWFYFFSLSQTLRTLPFAIASCIILKSQAPIITPYLHHLLKILSLPRRTLLIPLSICSKSLITYAASERAQTVAARVRHSGSGAMQQQISHRDRFFFPFPLKTLKQTFLSCLDQPVRNNFKYI